MAGLVCAKELARRGVDDFLLLEAADEPGGRVRSRVTPEGFVLDRGFQVLLDSYPAVRRHLDIAGLEPRYFESGAVLHDAGRTWTVADPRRHPGDLRESVFGDMFPVGDKARLVALVAELMATPDGSLLAETRSEQDVSTAHYLWSRGFSSAVIERFLRPFFGGVFLDEKLSTSAGLFRYYLKKFATGRALLPAGGIGEITRQLAAGLPFGKLRLNCRVRRLTQLGGGVDGVVTEDGETITCEHLILATDAPATERLLERQIATPPPLGTTVVYFASRVSLYERGMLVLPTGRGRFVRHFVQLTNVAPEYAPTGLHLVSATVLNRRGLHDDPLFAAVAREIAEIYPVAAGALEPVAAVTVPYAQHGQPAGFARGWRSAPVATHFDNVWLTGDQTGACSIQAAMASGEQAAAFFTR